MPTTRCVDGAPNGIDLAAADPGAADPGAAVSFRAGLFTSAGPCVAPPAG